MKDGVSCVRLQHVKGLCAMHYEQIKAQGKIVNIQVTPCRANAALAALDRFGGYLQGNLETGCWIWMKVRDGEGYGKFSVGGGTKRAHRWLWRQLVNPELADDIELDHIGTAGVACDTACCRPGHLQEIGRAEHGDKSRGRAAALAANPGTAFYPSNGHRTLAEVLFGEEHRLPTALHG